MTRKRIRHARMMNEIARKSCLKKRKEGLFKKFEELSILCDVPAIAVIYSPEEDNLEVFPSMEAVHQTVTKFFNTPEMERIKRMTTLESYLKERSEKEEEKGKRIQRKNAEKEMIEILNKLIEDVELNQLDEKNTSEFSDFSADLMKQIQIRDYELNGQMNLTVPPAAALDGEGRSQVGPYDVGPTSLSHPMKELMDDLWFMETMGEHQSIFGTSPIGGGDIGGPSTSVASKNQQLDDLDSFSP